MNLQKVAKRRHRAPATVHIQELTKRRRIKYTYQKKEYYISLPKKNVLPETIEKSVAKLIEIDIVNNNVDITQQSYKKMLVLGKTTTVVSELVTPRRPDQMILHEELKKYYIATGRDINIDFYNACHVMLKNWGENISVEQIPE